MARSFEVDDVLGGAPSWGVMMRRAVHRTCPRCGGGDVFLTRWSLRDRCPTCGYRFEREPGFRLGAWFINFMVLEVVHFTLAMAFIAWLSANPGAGLLGPLAVVVVTSIVVPVAFFPWSRTLWAAIDLGMTPMELDEIIAAADAITGDADTGEAVTGDAVTGHGTPGDIAPGDVATGGLDDQAPNPQPDSPDEPDGAGGER